MLNAVVIVLVVDPDNEAAALLHVMVITENAIFLSSSEPSGFLRRHTVSEVPMVAHLTQEMLMKKESGKPEITVPETASAARNTIRRIACAGMMLLLNSLLLCCSSPNFPTKPIELKYYANGPWGVTVSIGSLCCDSVGDKFDVYYPTALGQGGFQHPILTWGNGTDSLSSNTSIS